MAQCPSKLELSNYVAGVCTADAASRIEGHLTDCAECVDHCISLDHDDRLEADVRRVLDDEASDASAEADSVTPPIEGESGIAPEVTPKIGGFRITKELGRGGMGAVYLAEQLSTKRLVALKVLLQGPFASDVARKRFEREVELAALLDHPHIVTILESGLAHGHHYFAMKYVEGLELDRFVKERGLGLRETLRLFASICRAVSYAHQRGILHRDLKPSNILVDDSGAPHVLDFGLARFSDPQLGRDRSDRLLSTPGAPIGTLPYMSPEQTTGMQHELDVRSDVYSLGVILFRLLTGKHPYSVAGDVYDALRNINEAEPKRPSSLRRGLGDEVDTIVLTALAKDRDRRYQSADALAEDLERLLAERPILAKRDSTAYVLRKLIRRHRPVVMTAVLILVMAVVALTAGLRGRAAKIDSEVGAIKATLVDDPAEAVEHIGRASGAVLRGLSTAVSTMASSQAYTERITGARGGLLLAPEAFRQSVDGGMLWQRGEWLEWCHAPQLATPQVLTELRGMARNGTDRQKYVALCLLGCLADHADAQTHALCAETAAAADHPGVALAAAWAAGKLGAHVQTRNSDAVFHDELTGMTFVRLPRSDSFRRGSDEADRFRYDDEEQPQDPVTVGGVYMAATEVVQGLYARFLEAAVDDETYRRLWHQQAAMTSKPFDAEDRDDLAAGLVSFNLAERFCDWLSTQAAEARPARTYRLPTEDEWEYAARGGSTRRFCYGDDPKYAELFANCDGGAAWHVVARRMPNFFGLFDMHGGLWEWTASTYPPELATAQGLNEQKLYVYRGGAYYSPAVRCRSAQRNYGVADATYDYTGIRLVMEMAGP